MNSTIPFEQKWHYRIVVWPIMIFVIVFIVWAGNTEVDEVVRGEGRIVPSGSTKVIQHLEGGIVSDILVHEGDLVTQGDILYRLKQAYFLSNQKEQKVELLSYQARVLRLNSEIDENEEVFFSQELKKMIPNIVDNETRILKTNMLDFKEEYGLLLDELQKKRLELKEVQIKQNNLSIELEIAKENLKIQENLVRQGAASKQEYLTRLSSKQSLVTQIDTLKNKIPIIEEEIEASQKKRSNYKSKRRSKSLTELNRVQMALNKLLEKDKANIDREARKEIRSPVNGKINKLYFHTRGGIIKPGDKIIEITPIDDSLMVEAKVKTIDRAHVWEGQVVSIEVTAFDFSRYGHLDGKLINIAPDSFVDKDGQTYYTVKVKTDQVSFSQSEPILPGMVANVNILTGKKTILEYILKPLKDISRNSLREQ
jgi:membrane fusion protein, adhesin transport system